MPKPIPPSEEPESDHDSTPVPPVEPTPIPPTTPILAIFSLICASKARIFGDLLFIVHSNGVSSDEGTSFTDFSSSIPFVLARVGTTQVGIPTDNTPLILSTYS